MATFRRAAPYADDEMNLPVHSVEAAIPFYVEQMGFKLESQQSASPRSAVLKRDQVRIGLAENGGDPSQEGCFFEVDNLEAVISDLKSRGLNVSGDIREEKHGDTTYRLFFVVAPDGLCYCIGEPVSGE